MRKITITESQLKTVIKRNIVETKPTISESQFWNTNICFYVPTTIVVGEQRLAKGFPLPTEKNYVIRGFLKQSDCNAYSIKAFYGSILKCMIQTNNSDKKLLVCGKQYFQQHISRYKNPEKFFERIRKTRPNVCGFYIKETQQYYLLYPHRDIRVCKLFKCNEKGTIKENISELQLYHGSCADFDKFDDKFVLTGVGQMAFGYGFYLTNSVDSARCYAMGGKLYTVEVPDGKYLNSDRISKKEAEAIARKFFKYFLSTEYGREAYGENPHEFWISECSYIEDCISGNALYGTISSILGSDKETSAWLHSIGYIGIEINASNGTTGEKFKNYLIFDKDDIRILSKADFK